MQLCMLWLNIIQSIFDETYMSTFLAAEKQKSMIQMAQF